MNSKFLKTLLLGLLPLWGMAQIGPGLDPNDRIQIPNSIPPSPTVANLMTFEEVPVDLYTGQPDINIPLISKDLGGGLSLPVALRYSTTGIKIYENSGWTGTGWSLEAGGTVSRTVRGIADEKQKTTGDVSTGIFHLDYFWAMDPVNDPPEDKAEFGWNVLGTSDERYDNEHDLFQFSMLGMSGRFIVVKVGGTLKAKQLNPTQNYNINIIYDQQTYDISGFIITDTNGYDYWFGTDTDAIEINESTPYSSSIPIVGEGGPTPGLKKVTTKSAWHLKSIKINGHSIADFTYTGSDESYNSHPSRTSYRLYVSDYTYFQDYMNTSYSKNKFRPLSTYTFYRILTHTKKLSEIRFRDQTLLRFTPRPAFVHPETGGICLEKVQYIQQRGTGGNVTEEVLRTFGLNYDLSNDDDSTEGDERLFLSSVSIKNGLYYTLNYSNKDWLPRVNDQQYTVEGDICDDWGYYNIYHGGTLWNIASVNKIKAGLLSSITYPTGGKKVFNFEPHTYAYLGAETAPNTGEGSKLFEFPENPYNSTVGTATYNFSATAGGTGTGSTQFTIDYEQDVIVTKSVTSSSDNPDNYEVRFTGVSSNNQEVSSIVRFTALPTTVRLSPGTYESIVRIAINPTNGDGGTVNGYVNIYYRNEKHIQDPDYKHELIGGGVRIKQIKFIEPADGADSIKRIFNYDYHIREYDFIFQNGRDYSSGVAITKDGPLMKQYIQIDDRWLYKNPDMDEGVTDHTATQCQLHYYVQTNEMDAGLTKGGYIGYRKVTVSQGEGTNANGSTESYFSSAYEHPSNYYKFIPPFYPENDVDYKRGLLREKIIFNKEGNRLSRDTLIYTPQEVQVGRNIFIFEDNCKWKQFYDSWDNYVNMQVSPGYGMGPGFEGGYQNCGPQVIQSRVIPQNACRAELTETITTQYFYDGATVLTTDTKTTYAYNQENYQLAQQIGIVNEAGAEHQYKTTYEYPVGGYDTSLFSFNEQAVIDNSMTGRNLVSVPIVTSSYRDHELLQQVIAVYDDSFTGNIPRVKQVKTKKTASGTAENRLEYHKYDTYGNVLKASKPEGTPVQYVYGYDESLPVAKIEGDVDLLAAESTVNSIKLYSSAAGYSEANLKVQLDNLRNQFTDAQVTTLTHEPGVGVTSVTDSRGNTVTYEYDDMGRLILVKDKDGNLVSENFYNYRTQFP